MGARLERGQGVRSGARCVRREVVGEVVVEVIGLVGVAVDHELKVVAHAVAGGVDAAATRAIGELADRMFTKKRFAYTA